MPAMRSPSRAGSNRELPPTDAGRQSPSLLFLREEQICAWRRTCCSSPTATSPTPPTWYWRSSGSAARIIARCISSAAIRALPFPTCSAILRITKQSLARVLGALVDQGYVAQSPGRADRRQRLLTLTAGRRGAGAAAVRAPAERLLRRLSRGRRRRGGRLPPRACAASWTTPRGPMSMRTGSAEGQH